MGSNWCILLKMQTFMPELILFCFAALIQAKLKCQSTISSSNIPWNQFTTILHTKRQIYQVLTGLPIKHHTCAEEVDDLSYLTYQQ